ncbi:unnamed protein product, partial [marine sediment metagenome]
MKLSNRLNIIADTADLKAIKKQHSKIKWRVPEKLLSPEKSNTKLAKNGGKEFVTWGLSFAPATANGFVNVCPSASPGCMGACLFTSGRGVMQPVKDGRLNRVFYMLGDTDSFVAQLQREITNKIRTAKRQGKIAVFRLNVISDIGYETGTDSLPLVKFKGRAHIDLTPVGYSSFPEMIIELGGIVYDYTKRGKRLKNTGEYSLTFSRSEINNAAVLKAVRAGGNGALVFKLPEGFDRLPEFYAGLP